MGQYNWDKMVPQISYAVRIIKVINQNPELDLEANCTHYNLGSCILREQRIETPTIFGHYLSIKFVNSYYQLS